MEQIGYDIRIAFAAVVGAVLLVCIAVLNACFFPDYSEAIVVAPFCAATICAVISVYYGRGLVYSVFRW